VRTEQQRFIAEYAPFALAKAYVCPGGLVWLPYVFYAGGEMIGFVELAYEPGRADNILIYHSSSTRAITGVATARRRCGCSSSPFARSIRRAVRCG
jgi:hypothetical protein